MPLLRSLQPASGGARTSRQPGHFQVTKVVRQVIRCSAVKEPGHFEVRKSSIQVTGFTFFLKRADLPFLVVALKTQAANASDCFAVKIKTKRSDMVTVLFSVHSVTEAKQIFQPGHLTPGAPRCSAATAICQYSKHYSMSTFASLALTASQ